MSLQVNCIDELLGTQVTCNHRLPGMQESMCFQVISTCKGWTTIFTHKLLLISVSCHMSFEICTFDKCSATICTLVPFVSFKKQYRIKIRWSVNTNVLKDKWTKILFFTMIPYYILWIDTWKQKAPSTLQTIKLLFLFFTIFSLNFCLSQGNLFNSKINDHSLKSHDLSIWFKHDTVRRIKNQSLLKV